MPAWYAFRALKSQVLYGYGSAADAERFADYLNRDRKINLYCARALNADHIAELSLEGGEDSFRLSEVFTD